MGLRGISIFAIAIALSGCGNNAQTFGEMIPKDSNKILQHKNYNKIDTFSFQQARVKYPAAGGEFHTIPIGPYILDRVVVSHADFDSLRMKFFSGVCEKVGDFLPKVDCALSLSVEITRNGKKSTLSSSHNSVVGNMMARTSKSTFGLEYTDYGDGLIQKQITPAIDSLVDGLR